MCTQHLHKLPTNICMVYTLHVTHITSTSGTNIYSVQHKHTSTHAHTHIPHIQPVYPCIPHPSLSSEHKALLFLSFFLPLSQPLPPPPLSLVIWQLTLQRKRGQASTSSGCTVCSRGVWLLTVFCASSLPVFCF